MGTITSQITSITIVYSTVYSDADHRKYESSASLAFVRGIHRGPVNFPHKWPVTRKMFQVDDVIMSCPPTSRPAPLPLLTQALDAQVCHKASMSESPAFKLILQIVIMSISGEIALIWTSRNPLNVSQYWFGKCAVRQHAIACANVHPDKCHHIASLSQNELRRFRLALQKRQSSLEMVETTFVEYDRTKYFV